MSEERKREEMLSAARDHADENTGVGTEASHTDNVKNENFHVTEQRTAYTPNYNAYQRQQQAEQRTAYTPNYNAYQRQQQAEQQSAQQQFGQQAQQRYGQQSQQTTGQRTAYTPNYNAYQRQTAAAGQTKKQNSSKKRWGAVIASALVFGLLAGGTMYATNLIANRIYPSVSQAEVVPEPTVKPTQTTLSTTGSTSDTAQTQVSPTGTKTVAQVAEEAMPALVTIGTISVQEMQSWFGVQSYEAEGAGTGVIVGENDTELLIATNNHVIEGAKEVSVGFIDETAVAAQIKGTDSSNDLAIVSVKLEEIPEDTRSQIKIATIGDSDALVLGEQVVAIGNALGVGQSVTSGYISAFGRELDLSDGHSSFVSSDLIQTDAAINSGNSGGALLNMRGELIGINEAKSAYTSSGVTVDNVGYAIPMSKAQPILEELMNLTTREVYDEEEQGYLGVSLADVSSEMAQMYNMPEGVCFTDVAEGSPADKAGARKGDVLTEVEGRSITSSDALMREMQYYRSGDTVELTVLRADNGEYKEQTLSVTLGTKEVLNSLYEND